MGDLIVVNLVFFVTLYITPEFCTTHLYKIRGCFVVKFLLPVFLILCPIATAWVGHLYRKDCATIFLLITIHLLLLLPVSYSLIWVIYRNIPCYILRRIPGFDFQPGG